MNLKTAQAAILLTLMLASTAAHASPQVVASIKPLHSLVSGVMSGVAAPRLLIRGHASPHNYSLRPSDASALQEATVVFWVGVELEPFLEKPLQSLARQAKLVALSETKGLHWLKTREDFVWGDHAHEEHEAHAEHGTPHRDPHLWLDPRNAAVLVAAITKTLQTVDPDHAATYQKNGLALQKRLASLDAQLRENLTPVSSKPYLVFHDAYQYFEKRYGLRPLGVVMVHSDRPPGVKWLQSLRRQLQDTNARCVFTEPQFPPKLLEAVTRGLEVKQGELDPVGAELTPGPDLYFTLLNNLGASLRTCLLFK
ncbi:MAG: zinc ABC transporter substrate-binding protein [SAR324 cluster bacterium]|nr:zinc ABC transporter substrate-binding protein [SAR324 cluster bacterium]